MSAGEFGFVGALLAIFWKMLDIAKVMFLDKRQLSQPAMASSSDPLHVQRTEEVHEKIVNGSVGCKWKDRDEVRDSIEAMRAQTSASKQQTAAITALTNEIRLSRTNGGNGK